MGLRSGASGVRILSLGDSDVLCGKKGYRYRDTTPEVHGDLLAKH